VLALRPAGSASIIALATNTMLLGSKLLITWLVCLRANNARTATSIYKVVRVAFNVIDSNFLVSDDWRRNAHKITWSDVEAEYASMQRSERGEVKLMAHHAQRVMSHIVSRRDSLSGRRGGDEADDEAGATPKSAAASQALSPARGSGRAPQSSQSPGSGGGGLVYAGDASGRPCSSALWDRSSGGRGAPARPQTTANASSASSSVDTS
jgi:hypothetical protein